MSTASGVQQMTLPVWVITDAALGDPTLNDKGYKTSV
jgi:hypothetical protein